MLFHRPYSIALLLAAAVGVSAFAASTQVSAEKPVINFRLPNFTPEGYRAWMVRGSEGRYLPKENRIDVTELTLSIYSGGSDDKLTTMILSPSATVLADEGVVFGESTIRVINDDFEATGTGWRYEYKTKKTLMKKNVRVVFQAELNQILQ